MICSSVSRTWPSESMIWVDPAPFLPFDFLRMFLCISFSSRTVPLGVSCTQDNKLSTRDRVGLKGSNNRGCSIGSIAQTIQNLHLRIESSIDFFIPVRYSVFSISYLTKELSDEIGRLSQQRGRQYFLSGAVKR